MEIANNPGFPEQDAFCGNLKNVHLRHSSAFPTLCTLTVGEHSTSSQHQEDTLQNEWRLPNGDPCENPQESQRFALHTLDIYFWDTEDSNQFLNVAAQLLSASQIDTDRQSPTQEKEHLSSVVQQLEDVAVSEPAYQNDQTRNSQSDPIALAPASQAQPLTSFPPPPPSAPLVEQQSGASYAPSGEKTDPASFAPLPYNPAAPAAPEPIRPREKTPPPVDGMTGTGLAAAVAADNGIPYTPTNQMIGGTGYASPPPSNQTPGLQYSYPASYASPPPSAGPQSPSHIFNTHSSTPSPGMPVRSYTQPLPGGQGQPTSRQGSLSFGPPPQDPNAHIYDQHIYGGAQAPQHQGQAPLGGFPSHSYVQQSRPQQIPQPHDIHRQFYQPDEMEGRAMKNYGNKPTHNADSRFGDKLAGRAEGVESRVNKFFKKLEKKI